MGFTFDPQKSGRNLAKHGINFIEAQRLWDEPRSIVVGQIDARHWSAVITYRADDIRIISVRRSREEEVVLYES